jgi:nitroreductase
MASGTTDTLAEAAREAGHAPSIANSQPWHWRVAGETLELSTDSSRQLVTYDPAGRLMVLSCGAALHHARMALAVRGWACDVDRIPDRREDQLLARVTVSDKIPVTPAAVRLMETIQARHTDRRPVSDEPVPGKTVDEIRAAAEAEHTWLHVLRADDILDLATAAGQASAVEDFDPAWRTELRYWFGGEREEGFGVPSSTLPEQTPQTTVSNVDYGSAGELPVHRGHDRSAVYAILYGSDDSQESWLRAGEALSAAWLAATELGVAVTPLSATVEVPGTRQALRRLVSQLGEPYLVLRMGIPNPADPPLARTPRLAPDTLVEIQP